MSTVLAALLHPGTKLMMNLRLPAKFMIISAAFVVPLSITLYAVVEYANSGIQFAQSERAGVVYIKAINDVLQPALTARSDNRASRDHTADLGALQKIAAQDVADELKLRAAISQLSHTSNNDQYIEALMELTDRVADNSNLMLDPDLESFYTMMIAVHYSQRQMDATTALGQLLAGMSGGAVSPQQLAAIQDLVTRIEVTDESAQAALQRITDAKAALGARLDGKSWHQALKNLIETARIAETGGALDAGRIRSLIDKAEQESWSINELSLQGLDALLVKRITGLQLRRDTYLLVAFVGLLLSAYLIAGFYASNQRGFEALVTRMHKLAAGDLSVNYPAQGKDEIGVLIDSFNNSRAQLQVLVERIRHAADTISTAGREISSANMDLAQRSATQAAVIDETAQRVTQVTEKVQANLTAASNANRIASDAHNAAGNGKVVVDSVVDTMDAMTGSSKRIGAIIDVINEIAFQTNLLALNAAVEAARAGEQGRGFAVVAGEVRNLAQRCAKAANEITQLIKASVGDVDKGVTQVAKAGTSMNEILGAVVSVSDLMSDMTDASKVQIEAIRGIDTAVGKINSDAQQNAALVEQTAAAADLLREQVEILMESVGHFTLESLPADTLQRAPVPAHQAAHLELQQVA